MTIEFWQSGIHEVFVKDGVNRHRVGYFDSAAKALAALSEDQGYRAAWFSLNVCPGVPAAFEPNRLYQASARYKKTDYLRRQLLLIDCDPKRDADTSSTDKQKESAWLQVKAIRAFLDDLGFPEPVVCDSANGFHLLYLSDEANDEATEKLVRDLLAGLSAKFSTAESLVDARNFEANRLVKLYGSHSRKGSDPTLWRLSKVLEVPTRDLQLPKRETVTETAFEPVPRSLLEAAVRELPVPRATALGEMDDDAVRKTDWLRKLCEIGNVTILKERRRGKEIIFDIVCPWERSHGSTTSDSSTIVSYESKRGYGFSCLHGGCESKDTKRAIGGFKGFRKMVDPRNMMSNRLPSIPEDTTHAAIADYFMSLTWQALDHVAGRAGRNFVQVDSGCAPFY